MIFQEPMTSLNPVMRAGQLIEYGPSNLILHQPSHAYTRELLSALPEIPRAGQV